MKILLTEKATNFGLNGRQIMEDWAVLVLILIFVVKKGSVMDVNVLNFVQLRQRSAPKINN